MISYLMNLFFGKQTQPKQLELPTELEQLREQLRPPIQQNKYNADELMNGCYRDNNKEIYINSLIAKISELEKENKELKDKLNKNRKFTVTKFDKVKISKIEQLEENTARIYFTMGKNVNFQQIHNLSEIPAQFKVGNNLQLWFPDK